MATSSIEQSLEEILSPKFRPESLTKLQLRSLLTEYSGLPLDELPPASAKKEVYLSYFEQYILKRKSQLLKRTKPEGKGILVVQADGSMKTTTGTPVKQTQRSKGDAKKHVEFDLKSGYFSDENPFQSPDKPATGRGRTPTPARRSSRRAVSASTTTSTPDDLEISRPSSRRFKLGKQDPPASPSPPPRKPQSPKVSPVPPKISPHLIHPYMEAPKQTRARLIRISLLLKLLFLFSFTSVLFLYLHFISLVPMCPQNKRCTASSFQDWAFAPWRRVLSDRFPSLFPSSEPFFCWPCPAYADCITDSTTGITTVHCHAGFKLYHPWLGLFGPACRPDPKQQGAADALAQHLERFLSERLGEALCSSHNVESLPSHVPATSPLLADQEIRSKAVFSERSLKEHVKSTAGPWQEDPKRFDSLFDLAIKRLIKASILSTEKKTPDGPILVVACHPVYPWTCVLGCNIRSIVKEHWMHIILVLMLVVAILYARLKIIQSSKRHSMASNLGEAVLVKLVEQEYLNRSDPMTYPSTVPVNQLRDALLVDVPSDSEKRRIWANVSSLIHRNSNVRESVTTIKGEQHRVWEWIGPEVLSPTKHTGRDR